MGTRSRIGIVYGGNDGKLKVRSIYCHWDGYPEYNGKMLMEYYNNNARAEELIDLGDISSLRKKTSTTEHHTFDEPQEDVTIAYHRDRGEEKRILELDFDDFKDYLKKSDIEFVYLRYRDEWLWAPINYDYITNDWTLGAFTKLEYKIQEIEEGE